MDAAAAAAKECASSSSGGGGRRPPAAGLPRARVAGACPTDLNAPGCTASAGACALGPLPSVCCFLHAPPSSKTSQMSPKQRQCAVSTCERALHHVAAAAAWLGQRPCRPRHGNRLQQCHFIP